LATASCATISGKTLQNQNLNPGQPWLRLIASGVYSFSHDPRIGNTYYRPLPMLLYRANRAGRRKFDAFYRVGWDHQRKANCNL
jgi:hypothetical protein